MLRASLLLPGALVAAACMQTRTVEQVGTVPALRAMPYDGQPVERGARLEGRSTTVVTDVSAGPEGDNSAIYVARHHASLAVRGGYRGLDTGFELDLAWVRGARPIHPGLGPPPDADVAIGVSFPVRYSVSLAEELRLGVGVTMGVVSVPIRYSGRTERDEAGTFALALVPSWRAGNLVLFGGLAFASEIDVPGRLVVDSSFDVPEARAAGGGVVLSAGATAVFASGLRLTGQVARPTTTRIADHGVQVDLLLGFELGEPRRSRGLGIGDPAPPPGPHPPAPPPDPPPPAPIAPDPY
jgi:hypothetical protein